MISGLVERGYTGRMRTVRSADTYIPLGPAADVVLLSEDDIASVSASAADRPVDRDMSSAGLAKLRRDAFAYVDVKLSGAGDASAGKDPAARGGLMERPGIFVKSVVAGSAASRDGRLGPGDQLRAVCEERSLAGRNGIYDAEVDNQNGDTIVQFRGLTRLLGQTFFDE